MLYLIVQNFEKLLNGTGLDVDGHTELDDLNVSGVSTFNDNINVIDNKRYS